MKKHLIFCITSILIIVSFINFNKPYNFKNTKNDLYHSIFKVENENLSNIQCPIPRKDRVLNKTQYQCVWASIEMLGRWAEDPKLINPSLTSRPECQSFSNPYKTAHVLNMLGVQFEQSYGNKKQSIELIKKAMKEKRGCMWTIPGHAMVIVHFDEEKNIFKWVDNSDYNLNIQTADMNYFHQKFDSWVLVIYADYSKIIKKTSPIKLEMFENNNKINYSDDYIANPINYNFGFN